MDDGSCGSPIPLVQEMWRNPDACDETEWDSSPARGIHQPLSVPSSSISPSESRCGRRRARSANRWGTGELRRHKPAAAPPPAPVPSLMPRQRSTPASAPTSAGSGHSGGAPLQALETCISTWEPTSSLPCCGAGSPERSPCRRGSSSSMAGHSPPSWCDDDCGHDHNSDGRGCGRDYSSGTWLHPLHNRGKLHLGMASTD